tara:strand:+ start:8555 stop:9709 length:1155 start_codon:yes stop_codon:yes gene_type:complete
MAETQQTAKSLHDIAKLLVQPNDPAAQPAPKAGKAEVRGPRSQHEELPLDEGNTEEGEYEDSVDEADVDDLEEVDGEELPLDEGNTEEHEEAEEDEEDEDDDAGDDDAAEQEADEDGFFQVNDDDQIEVKIDGEIVLRSIADAKKALSGEGAIEKRLKEATESRKQAQADHTMLLEQFSVAHNSLIKTVNGMEEVVFQPAVAKPDAALRKSNPQQYLAQIDAYEADQHRVKEGRAAIRNLVQQQQEALSSDIQTYREQQTTALVAAIPELQDRDIAPRLLRSMSTLAMEDYGYSAEEIQNASDHRLYRMIYDLARFKEARKPRVRKENTVKNLDNQASKRPRKLRSGATALKSKARKTADAQKAVMDNARATGKTKDIARTLIK